MYLLCSEHVGLDEVTLQMDNMNFCPPPFAGHLVSEHPEHIWKYTAS